MLSIIFFCSRVICGSYQSLAIYQDLWIAHYNHSPLLVDSITLLDLENLSGIHKLSTTKQADLPGKAPSWMVLSSFVAVTALNFLNDWWFYKLAISIRRRFITAKVQVRKSATIPRKETPRSIRTLRMWSNFLPPSSLVLFSRLQLRVVSAKILDGQNYSKFTTVPTILKKAMAGFKNTMTEKLGPSTQMEFEMQKLWADILEMDIDAIGIDDNFFQLGGDSTQAIMMVAAAQKNGLRLTVADMFTAPTISALTSLTVLSERTPPNPIPFELLSKHMVTNDMLNEAATLCNVLRDSIEDLYPCTPLQEALMAVSMKVAGAYNARHVIELNSTLDMNRFCSAWEMVVQSIPILRTRIMQSVSSGQFVQVIFREHPAWVVSSDLHSYLEKDKELTMTFGAPLNRCAIIKDTSSARSYLVWTMHHAIYDGWALSLIIRALIEAYKYGKVMSDSARFNCFVKYVMDQNGDTTKAFWQSQLCGSQPSKFPFVQEANYEANSDSYRSQLSLLPRTTNTHITNATIIRAAWALLMCTYERSKNVVIGVTVSGRNAPVYGVDDMIGPTIATIPVPVSVVYSQTLGTYLEVIQKQSVDMIPFEQYGMINIKSINSETQSACEFQSLLVIHPKVWSEDIVGIGHVDKCSSRLANDKTYPLVMECTLTEDGVRIMASFDSKVTDESVIARVTAQFEHVIQQMWLHNDDILVRDIKMVSPQDHRNIWAWNHKCPEAVEACVHEVIAKQVLARPNAPAICGWDGSFSYSELDKLSTELADCLISLGVGVESKTFVALCFEKSAWAIVAILGVLKAGGACVSLDPQYPIDRIRAISDDVAADIIISSVANVSLFNGFAADIVTVGPSLTLVNGAPTIPSQRRALLVQPSDPAFVVYTSGTTGKPKGIVLEHVAFCTSAQAHGAAMRLCAESRVLQFAAYTFDVSLGEIFSTLIHGGCVCVPSDEDRLNNLAGAIKKMKVTWACLTPSVANLLRPEDTPGLEILSVTGEAVTQGILETWAHSVYLINLYGPAECTVWSTYLGGVKWATSATNIGRGVGSVSWVVDAANHERLVPIGCVGELLIEGPILARGYYNNPEKTAAAFIKDPAWAEQFDFRPGRQRRFYKTGDLVQYNLDGTLNFIGRKDTQVKLRGQRVELGEVEHYILSDSLVAQAMVMVPRKGYSKDQLLALLVLRETESVSRTIKYHDLRFVDKSQRETIEVHISRLREHLSTQLPAHMLPVLWMVVDDIPLTLSGKLDRVRVTQWVQEMSEESYAQSIGIGIYAEKAMGPVTTMDQRLQEVLAQVLDLPEERILFDRSFLSLGGDSITAMQVVARARAQGITIKVRDILQSQSISELALAAALGSSQSSTSHEDKLDTIFPASPIQKMYLELQGQNVNQSNHHFNQSFLLRPTREIQPQDLAQAVEAVVRQHSMLRARFRRTEDGHWGQCITQDVVGSYRFTVHEAKSLAEVTTISTTGQISLDVERGPVLAVVLFQVADDTQLLFMVAHHLVIDLVSWRVIFQDIEDVLESGRLSAEIPFPFQAWCRLQAEHARQYLTPSKALPFDIAPANYAYWGMADQANVYADTVSESFATNLEMTSILLGSCHNSLGTEPVDIFLATLLHAFGQIFVDRSTPTVYSEGHGREPWDQNIDLSGTVGWFTTMSPLHVQVLDGADVVDTVTRTKDMRRRLPGNGWQYFASRFLNDEGIEAFGSHQSMEVLFNYLGRYQQLERSDGLLRHEPRAAEMAASDVGQGVQRLALFEVSVVVVHEIAHFQVVYNRTMQRQADIGRWVRAWEQSLQEATKRLSQMSAESTLSDFPLLSYTYTGLEKLKDVRLRAVGVTSFAQVEDIYPCSPMQQALLTSQAQTPGTYEIAATFEVVMPRSGTQTEVEKLLLAWQNVVERHPILRTVFIDSVSKERPFDQLVFKHTPPRTLWKARVSNEAQALAALKEQEPMDRHEARPYHQLTVCHTASGRIFCKLEINHAMTDGTSMQLILRDIKLAYEGNLPDGAGMPYSDYIKYLQDRPHGVALSFWKEHLDGVQSCIFPTSYKQSTAARQLHVINIDLGVTPGRLLSFCNTTGLTVSTILCAVWGLVLQHYTGSDDVCFGYLTSGRDILVDGIEDAIGPFINMLVRRLKMGSASRVREFLEQLQTEYLNILDHQHCSLAEVQNELRLSGQPLFNTAMSIQRMISSNQKNGSGIGFKLIDGYDPTEVCIG